MLIFEGFLFSTFDTFYVLILFWAKNSNISEFGIFLLEATRLIKDLNFLKHVSILFKLSASIKTLPFNFCWICLSVIWSFFFLYLSFFKLCFNAWSVCLEIIKILIIQQFLAYLINLWFTAVYKVFLLQLHTNCIWV